MSVETPLLKPEDVAEACRVHPQTVRDWLRDGKLPGLKLGGGIWRIRPEDFRSFLASARLAATEQTA